MHSSFSMQVHPLTTFIILLLPTSQAIALNWDRLRALAEKFVQHRGFNSCATCHSHAAARMDTGSDRRCTRRNSRVYCIPRTKPSTVLPSAHALWNAGDLIYYRSAERFLRRCMEAAPWRSRFSAAPRSRSSLGQHLTPDSELSPVRIYAHRIYHDTRVRAEDVVFLFRRIPFWRVSQICFACACTCLDRQVL